MAKKISRNYARPGKPISQQKFAAMVRRAEKGPFYPVEVLEKDFQEWKANRGKFN